MRRFDYSKTSRSRMPRPSLSKNRTFRVWRIVVKPNVSEATLAGGAISRSKLALAITAVNPFLKKTVLMQKVLLVEGSSR